MQNLRRVYKITKGPTEDLKTDLKFATRYISAMLRSALIKSTAKTLKLGVRNYREHIKVFFHTRIQ